MDESGDSRVEFGDEGDEASDGTNPASGYVSSHAVVSRYEPYHPFEGRGPGQFGFDPSLVAGPDQGQVGVEPVNFPGAGYDLLTAVYHHSSEVLDYTPGSRRRQVILACSHPCYQQSIPRVGLVAAALASAGPGGHLGWNVDHLETGPDQNQSQRPPVAARPFYRYPTRVQVPNPFHRLGVTDRRVPETSITGRPARLVYSTTRQSILVRIETHNHHDLFYPSIQLVPTSKPVRWCATMRWGKTHGRPFQAPNGGPPLLLVFLGGCGG